MLVSSRSLRSTPASVVYALLMCIQWMTSLTMIGVISSTLHVHHAVHAQQAAAAGGAAKAAPLSASQLRTGAEEALSKQDHATAIDLYGKLIAVEKSQINYFKRASVYIRKKQYNHAVGDLSEAIALDAEFIKGYEHRAKIYAMRGDCVESQADYQMIAKLKPKKPAPEELGKVSQCVTAIQQADAAMRRNDWESAKHWLTTAMEVAYDSNKLMLQRVQCHLKLNDQQSVLVDTRKILSHEKSNLEALSLRGIAYYGLGEHEHALTHWREGLRLAPEHVQMKEAYTKLRLLLKKEVAGDDASQQGRHDDAVRLYSEALAVDPSHNIHNIKIQIKHCNSLIHSKKLPAAIDSCSKAIEMDNGNIDAWCKRGEARLAAEQWDEAIHDYQHAVQMNQQYHVAQEGLQRAQMEKKKAGRKDLYKILGVDKTANDKTIKRAFRKLALLWHPDKHQDETKEEAEKKFREVADAHDILTDPELRAKYDRGEDVSAGPQQPQQQQHQHPFHHFQQGGQQFHFRHG